MQISRRVSKILIFTFVLTLCILFSPNSAKACLCFTPTDALWAFDESENVGIFQIQTVEKYAEGEKGYGYNGYKQATLKVQKVFKGKIKVGDTFAFRQGGNGDCVWVFNENNVGDEMLLYLGKKPKQNKLWEIFICSRSQFKKAANADLYYLENMKKYQGKTRIAGTLTKYIRPSFKGEKSSFEFLSGININISGEGKNINLKTDKNGVYEIYDLPPGKYIITPDKINGFKFSDSSFSEEIELGEEDQKGVDFDFEVANQISGTVFDTNGIPITEACLEMFPVQGDKLKSYDLYECVAENGFFKFDEIPPGNYVISIKIESKEPNKTETKIIYYPNALKREDAAQITVSAGAFFENFNIKVP
jgi:hypothetical protein